MSQTPLLYETEEKPRRLIKEMLVADQPLTRLKHLSPQALSTAEILALILGTKDALDLAQELLHWAGSLMELARKSETELKLFKGIGTTHVARIKASLELGKRLLAEPNEERKTIVSPADAANHFMPLMQGLEQEHLMVLTVNTRNRVLGTHTIYKGSLNSSIVRIAEVFRYALRDNAAAIILAHNHPSGDPSPSPEDIKVTKQLAEAGALMDIDVLDHVIIGNRQYISLKERGLGFD